MGSGYLGDIELKSVQASGLAFKIPSCGITSSVVYFSMRGRFLSEGKLSSLQL